MIESANPLIEGEVISHIISFVTLFLILLLATSPESKANTIKSFVILTVIWTVFNFEWAILVGVSLLISGVYNKKFLSTSLQKDNSDTNQSDT